MAKDYTKSSIKATAVNKDDKPRKVTKVIKGGAKVKQKSELSKMVSTMIVGEANNIKQYILYDVIIPTITDTIGQIVKGSIDILFSGEVRSTGSSRSRSGVSKVSYADMYDSRRDRSRDDRRSPTVYSYDDVEFDYRDDALKVLEQMDDIVEQYGVVRVADMFEMAGFTGNGPTDQNYGWTSTNTATVERNRYGKFVIRINRPSPIR